MTRSLPIDPSRDARIRDMPTRASCVTRGTLFSIAVILCACAIGAAQSHSDAPPLTKTEQQMAAFIDAHNGADVALLQQLVDINSGTMHLAGVEAVKDILAPKFEALGFQVRWVPMQSQTARAGDRKSVV